MPENQSIDDVVNNVSKSQNPVSNWYQSRVLPFFLSLAMLVSPLAAPVASYADGMPTPQKIENQIVFTRGNDIYKMNPDGSNQEVVYSKSGWKSFAPSVSPDGRYIAFNSEKDGDKNSRDIYIFDFETKTIRNLTGAWNPNERDTYPDWSSDGKYIAFSGEKGGNFDIYTFSLNDNNIKRLTTDKAMDIMPDWSPDNSRILYSSGEYDTLNLKLVNSDGTNNSYIFKTDTRDWNADWSPDGTEIVFERFNKGNEVGNIVIYKFANNSLEQITNNRKGSRIAAENPDYSPDGNKIVFSEGKGQDDPNSIEIFIYDKKNKSITKITNNNSKELYTTWK
jgi:Tol biopolymer transport system component